MGYLDQHNSQVSAFCKPDEVAVTPTTQTIAIPVTVPPMIASGSGSN
jgi:hypothetical protein